MVNCSKFETDQSVMSEPISWRDWNKWYNPFLAVYKKYWAYRIDRSAFDLCVQISSENLAEKWDFKADELLIKNQIIDK